MAEPSAARLIRRAVAEPLIALAGLALLTMMGATVWDVFARRILSAPLPGVVEIVEFAMVWCTFAGIAAAAFLGAHITVDIVDALAARRVRRAVAITASAATVAVFAALTYLAGFEFLDALDWGDTTVDLGIPHTAYWAAIFGGFALAAVLSLLRLIILRGREEA